MPLPLNDPRWDKLKTSYGDTHELRYWLAEAYDDGIASERLGEIINEVQHQGDTSSAMYAVAPHLVELAKAASPEMTLHLLSHAGLIYAYAGEPRAVPCPNFLADDFKATSSEAAERLARLLPSLTGFEDFKYAAAALAGFVGQRAFGRLIADFDYFDGQFHHPCLDEPFSLDE